MKIIINLPEYIYNDIKINPEKFVHDYSKRIAEAIINGTTKTNIKNRKENLL